MDVEYSLDEALAALQPRLVPLNERESVRTADGLHRVLAHDLVSSLDLPAFDCAAMDGYAVRSADCTHAVSLAIAGRALAGHPFESEVGAGQAVRIMTGAPLPALTDAVVMREDTRADERLVHLGRAVAQGTNVRRRGEHVGAGRVVLARGRRLGAADIALAASIGVSAIDVLRRLRIGVLSTGDELADAPDSLAAGGAYDGNRPLLCTLAAGSGYQAIDLGICADSAPAFEAALVRAQAQRLDVLLTTGGAAQGDADIVRQHGEVEFIAVNFRPGRGIAVAQPAPGRAAPLMLGLPGNAVAAFVMYQLLVRPLLALLAGAPVERPLRFRLPLAGETQVRPGRIEWRRGRFVSVEGHLAVALLSDQGSAMLRTVCDADALVAIGPQARSLAGEPVDVIPLSAFS